MDWFSTTEDEYKTVFPCRQGAHNSNAKITEEIAKEIKGLLANNVRIITISKQLNVSYSIVKNIKQGLAWSHLT